MFQRLSKQLVFLRSEVAISGVVTYKCNVRATSGAWLF